MQVHIHEDSRWAMQSVGGGSDASGTGDDGRRIRTAVQSFGNNTIVRQNRAVESILHVNEHSVALMLDGHHWHDRVRASYPFVYTTVWISVVDVDIAIDGDENRLRICKVAGDTRG